MRFFLDNDVDVGVCRLLRSEGHDCWAASDIGLSQAPDDTLSVYADDRDAVLVTHDAEFTARRKRRTFGRHVRLMCSQPDAVEILQEWLEHVVLILDRYQHVVVVVSRERVERYTDWE